MNKKEPKNVNCLTIDDEEEVTNPFVLSNSSNKFFITIVEKIEGKIVKTNKKHSHFLENPLQNCSFWHQ